MVKVRLCLVPAASLVATGVGGEGWASSVGGNGERVECGMVMEGVLGEEGKGGVKNGSAKNFSTRRSFFCWAVLDRGMLHLVTAFKFVGRCKYRGSCISKSCAP